MAFVHLHVHSQYSILDGTMDPKALAKQASALGMSACAQTDTGNLYGGVAFAKACKDAKVAPIVGAELLVDPLGIKVDSGDREHGAFGIVALVLDGVGYENLCRLITTGIFEGMHYKPRIDLDLLAKHREGLVVLSGGRNGVLGPVIRGDEAQARAWFGRLAAIFDAQHLYLELVDHGVPGQEACNALARRLAAEGPYRTVVTNAVHYKKPEDAAVLDVLHAIARGGSLAELREGAPRTDQAYLKSEDEMRALFPEDGEAIDRTAEIAARAHFKYHAPPPYRFPATTPPDHVAEGEQPDTDANWEYFYQAFPPPKDFGLPEPGVAIPKRPEGAGNLQGFFSWYGREGLKLRLKHVPEDRHPEYWERLEAELTMIGKMGFPAYLLIVAEFINWSKDNGIPVGPGRGSAAGSLVAYAMRITDIDPIRFDLLFERFLNPARISMPDIDVDFCQDRREEAIQHVREKYGYDLVSQIITYGTLKAKAAVRDVARVLDLSFNDADRIAKLIPDDLGVTLQQALDRTEELRLLRDTDPKVRRILELAQGIEGLNRQLGVHAAGVVIADKPLVNYAPLYRDGPDGGPVVQYDMKSAEGIGLIKFDFLGLKTLDQIRDAVIAVKRNHGVDIDMATIDLDDEPTWKLLQKGDALGVFQLESSGMRDLLTRLRPSVIDDLVALVALYRPGPLNSGMTEDFVRRKHNPALIEYALPMLEPILKSTYGTVVYQEQVMQVAQVMAGYSLGEADLLRRAMGKKDKAEMDRQRARFVNGSLENKVPESLATEIFNLLEKFAEYGFNKSHSAAYGVVSYQTAWLKTHYRAEYMAALMTIDAANTDKVLTYIQDCKSAGLVILPVSVNASMREFHVPPYARGETASIRYGIAGVKGIGDAAIAAILEARAAAGGRFRDASDFFERVDFRRVNRKVVECLVKAGGFDGMGATRAALLNQLEGAMSAGTKTQADRAAGQVGLFGGLGGSRASFRFSPDPELPLSKKLALEKEVLGLFLTGHPMAALEKDAARLANARVADLMSRSSGIEVRLLGLPAEVKQAKTKRGDKMAFVRLEDVTGAVECAFFADPWLRSQKALLSGEVVLVTGKLEVGAEEAKVRANSAERLSDVRARSTKLVQLRAPLDALKGERLAKLASILAEHRGACDSLLKLVVPGRAEVDLELPEHPVDPSPALEEALATVFGDALTVELS